MQYGALQTTLCLYYNEWLDVATCKDVDTNSTWVVDLTFKINLYSVPLFGVVCPNKKDIGTPLPKELHGSTKSHINNCKKLKRFLKNIWKILLKCFVKWTYYLVYYLKRIYATQKSMGSKQCDCDDTQSRCKHILALKKIVDKNYYNVRDVRASPPDRAHAKQSI